jgi:hypothetical protein
VLAAEVVDDMFQIQGPLLLLQVVVVEVVVTMVHLERQTVEVVEVVEVKMVKHGLVVMEVRV